MFCWVAGSDELGNIESLIGNSDEEKGRSSKVPKKGAIYLGVRLRDSTHRSSTINDVEAMAHQREEMELVDWPMFGEVTSSLTQDP